MQTLDLWRKPLKCTDVQYYSEIDNGWINNNPKLVKTRINNLKLEETMKTISKIFQYCC